MKQPRKPTAYNHWMQNKVRCHLGTITHKFCYMQRCSDVMRTKSMSMAAGCMFSWLPAAGVCTF